MFYPSGVYLTDQLRETTDSEAGEQIRERECGARSDCPIGVRETRTLLEIAKKKEPSTEIDGSETWAGACGKKWDLFIPALFLNDFLEG